MLYAKPWEHPNAVATLSIVILLSPRINCSTHCTDNFSRKSQHGDLVGHNLRLSNVLERTSRPSCKSLYATNTSHCKQETFPYEYPLHLVILSIKMHNRTLPYNSTPLSMVTVRLPKPASEPAHVFLLTSEAHRKSITSITAVLLPFVTHLLTISFSQYSMTERTAYLQCDGVDPIRKDCQREFAQNHCPEGGSRKHRFNYFRLLFTQ
jgi:hypothetical protein